MKFKRSQLKVVFLNVLFLLAVSLLVHALGTNSVVPLTANGTWTNQTGNLSSGGYLFRWSDVNDADIHLANCKLYINTSETGLFVSENEAGGNASSFANTTNSSTLQTEIFMNKTYDNTSVLNVNNTAFYWGVKCTNLSSSPTTGQTIPRVVYQDLIFPRVAELSKSFTNNTWITTDIRIEINVTDNGTTEGMFGDLITCLITNNSNVSGALVTSTTGETGINGTHINLTTASLADGIYSGLEFRCTDPAGNINVSETVYNVSVDQTAPVFDGFIGVTPTEGSNRSDNNIIINFTVTEINIDAIIVEFDGANVSLNLTVAGACNQTLPFVTAAYCNITNLTVGDKKDYEVRVYLNDSANNRVVSSTRTFSVTNKTPKWNQKDTFPNWTIERGVLNYTLQVNTSTPSRCKVIATDRSGVLINTTTYGVLNGVIRDISGNTAQCKGQITPSNINSEGAFTIVYNFTDGVGRENQTILSKGGVLTRLFAGWNIITYPDANKSAIQVCDEIEECSKVAWFNNTGGAKSFVTFSNSTPSVNNGTDIPTAEAIYVYVESNSWVITNDHLDLDITLETVWNFSLSVPGWNLVGLLHNVSMNTTMHVPSKNTTTNAEVVLGINNTYSSYFNSSASTFYSCKRSLNKCSGTSVVPKDINLPKGYGIWMLTPENYTINRSTMVG